MSRLMTELIEMIVKDSFLKVRILAGEEESVELVMMMGMVAGINAVKNELVFLYHGRMNIRSNVNGEYVADAC